MKKVVTLVIWVFAILVGGIYMSFPSSRVVRDAAKSRENTGRFFSKRVLAVFA
ncbi:hypothetical protein HMPREF9466_02946 [Fusobacterium necrophorum subsp. funduliforme 1_1_36S]|nr:hypothetical protein HMPREF9466_02946 [Fusobacterium necrophorum subsp. funduliforme 1_1_36S]